MKVAQLLEARRRNWRELDEMCSQMARRRKRKIGPVRVARFAALYRAACADLALADAYQLPPNTVQYLHQLVGRAHNQIYRSRSFLFSAWFREVFVVLPQKLFLDKCLWLSFAVFWGTFLAAMFLAGCPHSPYPGFAEAFIGERMLSEMKDMHGSSHGGMSEAMIGGYIYRNAGIGLQCFAGGLLIVPGLLIIAYNGAILGAVFGYMATQPEWFNFGRFVTAHGPFELTAVVLAGAAGLRLGFSIIETRGMSRGASLRTVARAAMPMMGVFVVLFCLAALIEATLSPTAAPYWTKSLVAVASCGAMMFYFAVLGYPKGGGLATR